MAAHNKAQGLPLDAREVGSAAATAIRSLAETLSDAPSEAEGEALHLLERLRQWDMMDTTADGPYWRGEIDRVLHGDRADQPDLPYSGSTPHD
jgi:hypothetical protein